MLNASLRYLVNIQKLTNISQSIVEVMATMVVVVSGTVDMPYDSACAYAGVQSLSVRRHKLGRRFFCSIAKPNSCLHDLLPQRRDSDNYYFPTSTTHRLSYTTIICDHMVDMFYTVMMQLMSFVVRTLYNLI